jgi:hypothetical protein
VETEKHVAVLAPTPSRPHGKQLSIPARGKRFRASLWIDRIVDHSRNVRSTIMLSNKRTDFAPVVRISKGSFRSLFTERKFAHFQ